MYLGRRIKRNHCLGWADNAEEGQRCVAPAASISQFAQEKEWKERGKYERKVPSENPCSQSVSVPEPFRAIGPTYVDLYSPYYAFLFRLLVFAGSVQPNERILLIYADESAGHCSLSSAYEGGGKEPPTNLD